MNTKGLEAIWIIRDVLYVDVRQIRYVTDEGGCRRVVDIPKEDGWGVRAEANIGIISDEGKLHRRTHLTALLYNWNDFRVIKVDGEAIDNDHFVWLIKFKTVW